MRKTLMILGIAVVLVATACGGDTIGENIAEEILENELGGEVDIDIDGDGSDAEINIQTDEGSISFGGGEVPDELTVPLPNGGDITTSFVMNDSVAVTASWPLSEYDALVAFYDDWTGQQPTDFEKSESTFTANDETIRSTTWFSNETDTTIQITNCPLAEDGGRLACLTISESR